jgi:putative transposase
VWAIDFVHDHGANGQKLECLTVVDEWTRECLAIVVAGSIRSRRVIDLLARLVSTHGAPAYLRSTTDRSSCRGRSRAGSSRPASAPPSSIPGKPWQNGTNESFIEAVAKFVIAEDRQMVGT